MFFALSCMYVSARVSCPVCLQLGSFWSMSRSHSKKMLILLPGYQFNIMLPSIQLIRPGSPQGHITLYVNNWTKEQGNVALNITHKRFLVFWLSTRIVTSCIINDLGKPNSNHQNIGKVKKKDIFSPVGFSILFHLYMR